MTCATGSQCRPILRSGSAKVRPAASAGDDEAVERPLPPASDGAGEGRVVVGVAGVGDPRLGALEDVVVAGRASRGSSSRRCRSRRAARRGSRRRAGRRESMPGSSGCFCCARCRRSRPGYAVRLCTLTPTADAHPDGGDLLDDLEVDLVGLVRRRRTPRGRAATAGRHGRGCGRPPRGRFARARRRRPSGRGPCGRSRGSARSGRWLRRSASASSLAWLDTRTSEHFVQSVRRGRTLPPTQPATRPEGGGLPSGTRRAPTRMTADAQ